MCFILSAIKLKDDEMVKNAILHALSEKQNANSDGSASLCYNDGKISIQRDLYASWIEMENNLKNFSFVNYHFRTATVGEKTVKNVHFWKIGDWSFAHNGGVTGMAKGIKSDSWVFFENLIRKGFLSDAGNVKGKKIKEYVNKTSLWGRFVIINSKTKNIYFFGDFELYLLNKSYLVFTSAPADFEAKLDVMGLQFDIDEGIEKLESKIDGVWMYDYTKKSFKQIFEKLKDYTGYNNATYQGMNDDYPDEIWDKDKGVFVPHPLRTKKEEANNLNRKEKEEKPQKTRTQESYIKEYYGRLEKQMEDNPYLEDMLSEEIEAGIYNEMGRTEIEETYWQLWMAPQLEANNHLDFRLRADKKQLKEGKKDEVGFSNLFSSNK